MKLHLKKWRGHWAVFRDKHHASYGLPILARSTPTQAFNDAKRYLEN